MFNIRKNKGQFAFGNVNIFGEGTRVEGNIESDNDIRIDGCVHGIIKSKAKVVVGISGEIHGEIYCENADIAGKVYGKLEINQLLFLKAEAQIDGDISSTKLVIEEGAKFNGLCSMVSKEAVSYGKKINAPLQKEAV